MTCNPDAVVVTRHPALVELLRERGLIHEDVQVIAHAAPQDIECRHVYGVLPLQLAALAEKVTEIPLNIPIALRGQELTLEQLREMAGEAATYKVSRLD